MSQYIYSLGICSLVALIIQILILLYLFQSIQKVQKNNIMIIVINISMLIIYLINLISILIGIFHNYEMENYRVLCSIEAALMLAFNQLYIFGIIFIIIVTGQTIFYSEQTVNYKQIKLIFAVIGGIIILSIITQNINKTFKLYFKFFISIIATDSYGQLNTEFQFICFINSYSKYGQILSNWFVSYPEYLFQIMFILLGILTLQRFNLWKNQPNCMEQQIIQLTSWCSVVFIFQIIFNIIANQQSTQYWFLLFDGMYSDMCPMFFNLILATHLSENYQAQDLIYFWQNEGWNQNNSRAMSETLYSSNINDHYV